MSAHGLLGLGLEVDGAEVLRHVSYGRWLFGRIKGVFAWGNEGGCGVCWIEGDGERMLVDGRVNMMSFKIGEMVRCINMKE